MDTNGVGSRTISMTTTTETTAATTSNTLRSAFDGVGLAVDEQLW